MSALFRSREAGSPASSSRVPSLVADVMTSPAFAATDDVDLESAAGTMDGRRILHLPVVDAAGRLVGLVTYRRILHVLAVHRGARRTLAEVMRTDPVVVGPGTTTLRALAIMRQGGLGCLPVVEDGRLVGIVTERDFIRLSAELLEGWLAEPRRPGGPGNLTG